MNYEKALLEFIESLGGPKALVEALILRAAEMQGICHTDTVLPAAAEKAP